MAFDQEKFLSDLDGMTVLELNTLVKAVEVKFGVSAAAMAVAEALGAEKLIFISDVNGVRLDKNDPESVIHSLTAAEAKKLIDDGIIAGGMIPKVEACLATLNRGVGKVHIIDGQLRHSLLLEIYTTAGVGTEIVQSRQSPATRITTP